MLVHKIFVQNVKFDAIFVKKATHQSGKGYTLEKGKEEYNPKKALMYVNTHGAHILSVGIKPSMQSDEKEKKKSIQNIKAYFNKESYNNSFSKNH